MKTIGTPMEGKAAVYAAAGLGYSLALASDGTVYAWGNNEHGQLGNGTTINSTVSAAVSLTGNSALAPSTPQSNHRRRSRYRRHDRRQQHYHRESSRPR